MSQAPAPDPRREWSLSPSNPAERVLPGLAPAPRRRKRPAWPWNLALFLATVASVWGVGGVSLAAGLLSILFAHEMGHYLACRYYRVDATLPYFIPSPWVPSPFGWWPLSFVGTFGALIRIKSRIPHRKALFDIGIAGPLAGFAVCLPVLYLGLLEARIEASNPDSAGISLGEPLLFSWGARWLVGAVAADQTLVITPLGLGAWFGLFVTALNLIPIGQLDGGHVTYALLRGRAAVVSRVGSWICLALVYFGPNWLVWSALLRLLGRRHPPTEDDEPPVGRARVAVGLFGLVVFAVCFVPNPIVWSWGDFFEVVREETGF